MPIVGEYEPSAWEPVAEQVRLYEQPARAVVSWPSYDDYQAASERVIPLLVLEPVDA